MPFCQAVSSLLPELGIIVQWYRNNHCPAKRARTGPPADKGKKGIIAAIRLRRYFPSNANSEICQITGWQSVFKSVFVSYKSADFSCISRANNIQAAANIWHCRAYSCPLMAAISAKMAEISENRSARNRLHIPFQLV